MTIDFGFKPTRQINDKEFLVTTKDGRVVGTLSINSDAQPTGILRLDGKPIPKKFCKNFFELCKEDNGSGRSCVKHFSSFR